MNSTLKKSLCLIVYCTALYALFINAIPLFDPDEPVYGETAKEMIYFHDWLSPRIYGAFWYDKPPLFYWMDALSFSLFGVSTWAARLPSILAGTLIPLYLYLATRKWSSDEEAWISGLICASSLEFVLLAKASVTDMLLTLMLTVALLSFLKKQYVAAYIACGLAFLTKGPIGFAFPAMIYLLWLLAGHRLSWHSIMKTRWYWGIPLACLAALPWFLYMINLHGEAFVNTFFGYHNITRFLAPEHAGQNHYWLYIPVLIIGFSPWSGTLVAMASRLKEWWKDKVLQYLMIWVIFIFLFFSFSSTQLWSYILPLYPPLSLLAAHYLMELKNNIAHNKRVFILSEAVLTFIPSAALFFIPWEPDGGNFVKYGTPAVLILLFLLSLLYWDHGRVKRFFLVMGSSMVFLIVFTWGAYALPVSREFTSQEIAQKTISYMEGKSGLLYIDTFYRPSFAFYTNHYGLPLPEFNQAKLKTAVNNEEHGVYLPGLSPEETLKNQSYLLVQKKIYNAWPKELKDHTKLIWTEDTACFLFYNT